MRYLSSLGLAIFLSLGCSTRDEEPQRALEVVTLLCRSQVAFYVEKGRLTDRLADLQIEWLNLSQTTPNYHYTVQLLAGGEVTGAATIARHKNKQLHFVGIVGKAKGNDTFRTIICQGQTLPPRVLDFRDCPPGLELAASGIN